MPFPLPPLSDEDASKPKYLREMETYRALSADSDRGSGMRPMLK